MKPSPAHVEQLLDGLWRARGSDLLITAGAPPMFRVDGALMPAPGRSVMNGAETERLIYGVLGKQLTEKFHEVLEVDFSFSWGETARIRGNAFHQKGTAAMALRIIPYEIPSFTQLGLPEIVKDWAQLPKGFVMVTGPTGSGKSTTLASIIDYINSTRAVHIVTIEDPIEYLHNHKRSAVNQREVGNDSASFAAALRSALREDPDVVLVGEMRDPESIQAALTIAETGHLVFATLHTNDSAQSLDRIVDVFPSGAQPQIRLQLTHTLVGILNQALVPRIGGGRVAAFEVLVGTHAIRNLIREGKTRQIRNLVATGQRERMQTLEACLSEMVTQGLIEYDEACMRTVYPDEITRPDVAYVPAGYADVSALPTGRGARKSATRN